MKMSPIHIKWLLAVVLSVATFSVEAAQKAGQILFARGVVSIVGPNDSSRGARPGQPVFEGERIVTGRNSVVQVHLTDGTMLGLRGNSDYLIERQRYEPEVAETAEEEDDLIDQAGELFSGWMRMVTGAIGKSNPTSVRQSTSVATIGIRGTVYQVIHVPEEGLPGFPDTEPGTYLMLEQGEVQITGEGGTRTVRPGDVVFVPYGGGKPRPAPEKSYLFEAGEDSGPEDEGERDEEGSQDFGDENEIEDELNETVENELADLFEVEPLDPNDFAMAVVTEGIEGPTFGGATVADGGLVLARDSDGNYYPLSAAVYDNAYGAVFDFVLVDPGEMPSEVGTHQILDAGGNLVAQAWWGRYDPSQFTYDDGFGPYTATTDWHWVIGSDVEIDPEEIYGSFLSGSLTYSLAGGTSLRGTGGSIYNFDSGSATLELDKRKIGFDLGFQDTSGNVAVSGSGGLKDFFDNGVFLSGGSYSGTIFGGLLSDQLAGIIATLKLTDFTEDFQAALVFEQDGGSLTPGTPPLANPAMVGVYRYAGSPEQAVAQGLYEVSVADFGGVLAPVYSRHYSWLYAGDFVTYLVNSSATPTRTGTADVSGGASEVHWGVWAASDIEVEDAYLATGQPDGPMPYMVASEAQDDLAADAFFASQPSGTFEYAYVGGTGLIDAVTGTLFADILPTSKIDVSLGGVPNPLSVTLNLDQGSIFTGSGEVGEFYGFQSSGIQLTDGVGTTGNMSGQFVGPNMEGAISSIEISGSLTGMAIGTAAFERGGVIPVAP